MSPMLIGVDVFSMCSTKFRGCVFYVLSISNNIIIVTTSCSGANVYAEDRSLCTPVLIAAASKNNEAFQCLMTFMDLQDDQKNPVFKALNVTQHRIEIFQVSY